MLVCPNCGVIATNPLPLAALAGTALISGAKALISRKKQATAEKADKPVILRESYSSEERVRDALK